MLRSLRISNLVLIREAELELGAGLNAITGETGAGKTILTNAIGLLLGAKGDAALIGAAGDEAYVEAEFDGVDDDALGALAELRPEGEDGVVLARRIFADGRTRAYAWGRSAAREDVAAAAEALIAMSGQFEQRRLARPAYQRGVLDAFAGLDTRRRGARLARAAGRAPRPRRADARRRGGAGAARRAARARRGHGGARAGARGRAARRARAAAARHRARRRRAATAAAALVARGRRRARATSSPRPSGRSRRSSGSRPSWRRRATRSARRSCSCARRPPTCSAFLPRSRRSPGRLEQVEAELDELADLRRRYRVADLRRAARARGGGARASWTRSRTGTTRCRRRRRRSRRRRPRSTGSTPSCARRGAPRREPFAAAVAAELRGVGLGDGEFQVVVLGARPGATGADEVAFLIRPNAGLPFGPVAETASGGELSRVALAIAAVAGGETMVFDEIDAGIGGTTAHAVAETLRRLAERAQVVTITHLPQIATVADRHFRVEKVPGDPTHTRIEPLDDAQRRDEIERMLGGAEFLASLDR